MFISAGDFFLVGAWPHRPEPDKIQGSNDGKNQLPNSSF